MKKLLLLLFLPTLLQAQEVLPSVSWRTYYLDATPPVAQDQEPRIYVNLARFISENPPAPWYSITSSPETLGEKASNIPDENGDATAHNMVVTDIVESFMFSQTGLTGMAENSPIPIEVTIRGWGNYDGEEWGFYVDGYEAGSIYYIYIFGYSVKSGSSSQIHGDTLFYSINGTTDYIYPAVENNQLLTEISVAADENGRLNFNFIPNIEGDSYINGFWISNIPNDIPEFEEPVIVIPEKSNLLIEDENIVLYVEPMIGSKYHFAGDVVSDSTYYDENAANALNLDPFLFNGVEYLSANTTAEQQDGYVMASNTARDGWPFPINNYLFFDRETTIDSIGFYRHGAVGNEGAIGDVWFEVYGLTDIFDIGDRTDLLGKVRYPFGGGFEWFVSQDSTTEFMGLMLVRNKLDRNRLSGSIFNNSRINMAVVGDTLGDTIDYAFTPYLDNEEKSYFEDIGINGYWVDDPDSLFSKFGHSRIFYDWPDIVICWECPYMFNPSKFFGSSTGDTGLDGHEVYAYGGEDGFLINHLRKQKQAGALSTMLTLQLTGSTYLLYSDQDSVDILGGHRSWNGEDLVSHTAYIKDSTQPGGFGGNITNYDTVQLEAPSVAEYYDNRRAILDSFMNPGYLTNNSSWPDWFDAASLNKTDTTFKPSGKIKNQMKIGPETMLLIGNPTRRDSVLSHKNSWVRPGEAAFVIAAMTGATEVNIADIDSLLQPGQVIETGTDVLDYLALTQEDDATWKSGGYYRAQYYGQALNVWYDGACGTLPGTEENYSVGLWAADPSDTGIRLSVGATYVIEGDWVMESLMWMQYYRNKDYAAQQIAQGTEFPVHPYNGLLIERVPTKLAVEVHHYPGKEDQAGQLLPDFYGEDIYEAIHPCEINWMESTERLRTFVGTYFPGTPIQLTEFGYGGNPGSKFAPDFQDYSITSADTFIMIPSWGPRQIQSMMNWVSGMTDMSKVFDITHFYVSTDHSWNQQNDDDSAFYDSQGGFGAQFPFMGVYLPSGEGIHSGTRVVQCITDEMGDFVKDTIIVRTDSVWVVRHHHKDNPKHIADVIFKSRWGVDTLHDYSFSLLPTSFDVERIDINNGTWSATHEQVGLVGTIEEDVTLEPIIFKYQIE